MTALSIQAPFPIITDIDGQPLEDGFIWIGVANLPPIGNPITVYWDAALTQPAAQPIRTLGGYPMNSGTPGRLYVNSDYSILVQNKNGSTVYSAPAATERLSGVVIEVDATDVSFIQAGTGAVTRTAQSKMRDVVSVKDFGAVGNGVANDADEINAAYTYAESIGGATVHWPAGTYLTGSTKIICGPLSATMADANATLTYTGSGTAFEVQGINTSETNGQFHVMPYIARQSLDWNSGTDTTSVGLLLKDRKYNTFVIPGVKRFNEGLALQADTANFVCNTIQLGVIQNNRLGIDFSRITGAYGINQNVFVGGAVVIDSAYTTAANRIYVNMTNAAENNTNTFVGVNLEKGGNEKAIVCASSSNVFLNCRFEGSASTAGYITVSGNNNRFTGGSPASSATVPFVTWITDTGVGNVYEMANVVANKFVAWDTHSGSRPLRFGNGSAYPAVPIGAYGATSFQIGDSSIANVYYNSALVQFEVTVTSGSTTTISANHYRLQYAAPTLFTRVSGGPSDQDTSSLISVVSLNANATIEHTAGPAAGGGFFVLKAGVNKALTANQPVLFVGINGNFYEV